LEPKENVAQILGFKFQYYSADDPITATPTQLVWVAGLLVKYSLVALEHLVPHLYPAKEEVRSMFFEYTASLRKLAKKAGRFAGPKLMGSLGDDSVAPNAAANEIKVEKPEEPVQKSNQKALLCSSLFALGEFEFGFRILDQYPQFINMFPDIARNICRLLHIVVDRVHQRLIPNLGGDRQTPSSDAVSPPTPSLNLSQCPIFDSIGLANNSSSSQYTFFCADWKTNIPQPKDLDQLLILLKAWLAYIGPYLDMDILLFGKLIRIGTYHVSSAESNDIRDDWLSIISQVLLPGLTRMNANPAISQHLWQFLKLWPYTTRYGLYGEWRHTTYHRIPELEVSSTGARKDIQYVMNRLSKENVKIFGRHIGKIVHSNPTIAFAYILNAIESYDNMIPYVVEATRYLTDLDLDILTFCMLESLARQGKGRMEPNGTTIEKWIKSVSSFGGTLFKKHTIELDGPLQYITNQLLSNQVHDLIVLQELITSMSGIPLCEDATSAQIEASSGGEILRREAYHNDKLILKASDRLVDSLVKTRLTFPLGILLAQQCKDIVFRMSLSDDENPFRTPELKVLAWSNDFAHKSFLQYFEFLADHLGGQKYSELCPNFDMLINEYGIPIPVAFHIMRPKLSYLVQDAHMMDSSPEKTKSPSRLALDALLKQIEQTDSHGLSSDFYLLFWRLALWDVSVPHERYEMEMKKMDQMMEQLDSDKSARGAYKRRKEKEKALETKNLLQNECLGQVTNEKAVLNRIQLEKDTWFVNFNGHDMGLILLQKCLLPRATFSPIDAIFCRKFILLLHSVATLNFSLVQLLDHLLNANILHAMVFSMSEIEAKNYGIFLAGILEKLSKWHISKELYELEAAGNGLVGFVTEPDGVLLSHDGFRTLMHKWQLQLRKCFLPCLRSTEYIQLRNAMIMLDRVSEFFPAIDHIGRVFEKAVAAIEKTEDRGDVKQMARSYYAKLRIRKSQWIAAHDYWTIPETLDDDHLVPNEELVEEIIDHPANEPLEDGEEVEGATEIGEDLGQKVEERVEVDVFEELDYGDDDEDEMIVDIPVSEAVEEPERGEILEAPKDSDQDAAMEPSITPTAAPSSKSADQSVNLLAETGVNSQQQTHREDRRRNTSPRRRQSSPTNRNEKSRWRENDRDGDRDGRNRKDDRQDGRSWRDDRQDTRSWRERREDDRRRDIDQDRFGRNRRDQVERDRYREPRNGRTDSRTSESTYKDDDRRDKSQADPKPPQPPAEAENSPKKSPTRTPITSPKRSPVKAVSPPQQRESEEPTEVSRPVMIDRSTLLRPTESNEKEATETSKVDVVSDKAVALRQRLLQQKLVKKSTDDLENEKSMPNTPKAEESVEGKQEHIAADSKHEENAEVDPEKNSDPNTRSDQKRVGNRDRQDPDRRNDYRGNRNDRFSRDTRDDRRYPRRNDRRDDRRDDGRDSRNDRRDDRRNDRNYDRRDYNDRSKRRRDG
jgi:THO complex subunit 2